ncbi:MAG: hypothetical protein IJZ57_11045 [Clostridia bacterium]|nr:hypothetical protein [Clostridia bacterium]
MLKKLTLLAAAVVMLFCLSFNCTAVELDGLPHNAEWSESAIYSFESPEGFNNKVTFAYIRVIPEASANQLFLCVSMRVSEVTDAQNSAVLLSFSGGEEMRLNGDGSSSYNTDLYNVDYAMSYDEGAANIVYEIMLGVKHGIPSESPINVRLCDCDGVPSNVFGFDLNVVEKELQTSQQEKAIQKSTPKTAESKRKTTTTKADDFTFKKVEIDETTQSADISEKTTETVDLTQKAVDNSSVKKKVLAVVGAVCALGVATCAVYSAIKKSNKKEDKG